MPPKPYTPPTFPVSFSQPPAAAVDIVADTMDSIVLSEDAFTKCERLASGTVRCTRKTATPTEVEAVRLDALTRQAEHYRIIGTGESFVLAVPPTSPFVKE